MCWPILQGIRRPCKAGPPGTGPSRLLSLPAGMPEKDSPIGSPLICAKPGRRCSTGAEACAAGTYCGGSGRSWCGRLAEPGVLQCACWRLGESRAIGLRRPRRAVSCACGAAGATLRCMLASQAGLAAGWRVAARPSNILAALLPLPVTKHYSALAI